MKYAIDPGHGNVNGSLGGDGGAVGFLNEQNCALDIANRVISKLNALGHQAYNVRPSNASSVTNSLQKRCDSAANADYLISIHLNAGGGIGSEVFAMSNAGRDLAEKVLNELVNLGFRNRGVKDGSHLYVIRHSKPVAILIEVCFVDTKADANQYNSLGAEKIATAIVKGLTGQTSNNVQPVNTQQKININNLQGSVNMNPIRPGEKSARVKLLQGILNVLLGVGLSEDGDYGVNSQRAVARYQEIMHISVDSIVGHDTVNTLMNDIKNGWFKIG